MSKVNCSYTETVRALPSMCNESKLQLHRNRKGIAKYVQ